jgi:hypothetical protein
MSRTTLAVLVILTVALAAWAGDTGLGTSPFTSGDQLTATAVNAMNDAINDNATDITALEAYFSSDLLLHESGGLEVDVSAYDGILAITGGAVYELDTTIELEYAANLGAYASDILEPLPMKRTSNPL